MKFLVFVALGLGLLIASLGLTSEVWASQNCAQCDLLFNPATGAVTCFGTIPAPPGFPCQLFQSPHFPIVGYTQCWYNALTFFPPPPTVFFGCQTLQGPVPGGRGFACLDFIPECAMLQQNCRFGPHQCPGLVGRWRTCICK